MYFTLVTGLNESTVWKAKISTSQMYSFNQRWLKSYWFHNRLSRKTTWAPDFPELTENMQEYRLDGKSDKSANTQVY